MPSASSVSAIRVLPSASAARFTGIWSTASIRGTGMCTPTACTPMLSRRIQIPCGGTGDTVPTVGDGATAGAGADGITPTAGRTTRAIGEAGTTAITEATAFGDTALIMPTPIGDGVADITERATTRTAVRCLPKDTILPRQSVATEPKAPVLPLARKAITVRTRTVVA